MTNVNARYEFDNINDKDQSFFSDKYLIDVGIITNIYVRLTL